MKPYEDIVKYYRERESGAVLENISVSHAKTLFKNLLEEAAAREEEVCIYSGTLYRDFYDQLTETVEETLKKSKILVAVAKSANENQVANNAFADAVKSARNGLLKEGMEAIMGEGFPHFILVGNARYRIEKDDHTKEAIACFNDPRLGGLLGEARDKLKATPLAA